MCNLSYILTAPSAAPVNVTAEALNGTRVKVTWDPPPQVSQNGKISGYKVGYQKEI